MSIQKIRHKLGLNTVKFGDRLGVSGRTVESWEQGLRNPSKAVLLLIKKVFGIKVINQLLFVMLKPIKSNNSPGHTHNGLRSVVGLSTNLCPGNNLTNNIK